MSHRRAAICLLLLFFATASQANILARFHTAFGDMDVELFDKDKPITVANFIRYVLSGKFKNLIFHRLDPTVPVIQGGGWTIQNRGATNWSVNFLDPFPAIRNEYGAGHIYSNLFGTIAMAKVGGDTNSADSQWFFNLADNLFLDAHDPDHYFTVFGRVVRGTNVLNIFNTFQYYDGSNNSNVIVYVADYLNRLPMLKPVWEDTNFVYADISIPVNVSIKTTNNVPEISWDSIPGWTNRVEYSTTLPAASWNLLISTNGDGSTMKVQDKAAANRRFYRVTLPY